MDLLGMKPYSWEIYGNTFKTNRLKQKSALLSRKQGEYHEEPTWIKIFFFHYELLREWLSSKGIGLNFP